MNASPAQDSAVQEPSPSATMRAATTTPRLFWVGMAVFLIVVVFLGFGSTYGRQLALGLEISGIGVVETDWVVHLHAVVFVGWMAFLLMQTILVARGRTRTHMALGRYGGIALGILVLVVGILINYVQARAAVSEGLVTWAEWPQILMIAIEGWVSLLLFTGLLGLGLLYRRRPEVHRRYMVFATIMIVFAATSRMGYLLGPWHNSIGMGLMVAPLLARDLYTDGQTHPATLIGTGAAGLLLGVEILFG